MIVLVGLIWFIAVALIGSLFLLGMTYLYTKKQYKLFKIIDMISDEIINIFMTTEPET